MKEWAIGLVVLALGLAASAVWADQTNYAVGQAANPEFKVGLGPRPVAMGEAFAGKADDLNSTAWNPAGLAQMTGLQAGFMHSMYLQDTSLEYLAFAQGLFTGAGLGAHMTYWNYGGFERLNEVGGLPVQAGNFAPSAFSLAAGYGQWLLPSIAIGGTLKFMRQDIDGQTYSAFAADLGALFRPGVDGLQLGLVIQNLGTSTSNAPLPLNAKAGAAYTLPGFSPHDTWSVLADVNVPFGAAQYASVNLGTEYWYDQVLAVRAGYKIKDQGDLGGATGLTAGVGAKVGMFNLDYAMVSYGDLGLNHQLSFSVHFDGPADTPAARKTDEAKAMHIVIPKSAPVSAPAADQTSFQAKTTTLAPPVPAAGAGKVAGTSSKKKKRRR